MRSAAARQKRAFTLVELMIVVAIIGVLAALAVVGVRKYIASSKTAEAKQAVGAIARIAAVQYERERDISEIILAGGSSTAITHFLCTSATPVPATFNQVRGTKYQPSSTPGADFMAGTPLAGWQCLGFSTSNPIYFQYSYLVGGGYLTQSLPSAPVPTTTEAFEAAARGDLDGDNVASTMARIGEVRNGQVVMSTQIYTHNEME
jgi:type IV pilus assembly protein PilA